MKPTLLVLAAGMGSRYGGLKQIDPLGPGGETIMDFSIYDAIQSGFGKVVFVIREDFEEDFKHKILSKYEGSIEVSYVFQSLTDIPNGLQIPPQRVKPWGTAHAVMVAKNAIDENFAVINADDFYGRSSFQKIGKYLSETSVDSNSYGMVGFELQHTVSEHGSVARGVCEVANGLLDTIVERTEVWAKNRNYYYVENGTEYPLTANTLVSMNIFGFTPTIFDYMEEQFASFLQEHLEQPKAEYFIPLVVNNLLKNNQATMQVMASTDKWYGVTYQEDRASVMNAFKEMVESGVYPLGLSFK